MPLNQSITTWLALNACNDTSESGVTDPVTGQTMFIPDLYAGDYFDLTEAEANALSYTTNGTLHAGRYRRVQVDSGATAANVKVGTVGNMNCAIAPLTFNIVTSADVNTAWNGLHPVVFLNTVTPGNWCFVQELGLATVLGAANVGTTTVGQIEVVTTGGVVTSSATFTVATVGLSVENSQNSKLFKVIMDVPAVQG